MTTLVTGGAGFVGANVVARLLGGGERVRILDNLSRPGVERNVDWLGRLGGSANLEVVIGDVRDFEAVARAVHGVEHVFHFAAQVAVTTSLDDPRADFAINGLGTLNVLEALRTTAKTASLLYTSTNKVYGALDDVGLEERPTRYQPASGALLEHGIGEERPLEFHSPYGCSKGTADQYVLDYARTYGIAASVLRMSCIYGPRQFGTEDQGWVAHFLIRALRGEPITIYGDGRQVRDLLFVDDLVEAMLHVRRRARALSGRVFNVGGGPSRTSSLVELLERIAVETKRKPEVRFEPWRLADQRWYVSDHRALARAAEWRPRVGVEEGIRRLTTWLTEQPENAPAGAARQVAS